MYTASSSADVTPAMPSDRFGDVLGRLFPPGVTGVLAPVGECDSPHAEERGAVAGAGDRRRREFLAGRACAHAALAAIGRDEGPIGVGRDRQPLWPPGVVGSISHAGDWAGAVVARASAARGVGFDFEVLDPPLGPDVERLVGVGPAAGPGGEARHPLERYRSKIAFSAKESVYKCVYPATGWPLDFADVTVEVDLHASRFRAWPAARFRQLRLVPAALEGRVVLADGYLFTGLHLPAAPR